VEKRTPTYWMSNCARAACLAFVTPILALLARTLVLELGKRLDLE